MTKMVRCVQINNVKVWLYIQKLATYITHGTSQELIETNEYLCYFKLSPPTEIIFGELIRDEQKRPKLFTGSDEAEMYAMKSLKEKLRL